MHHPIKFVFKSVFFLFLYNFRHSYIYFKKNRFKFKNFIDYKEHIDIQFEISIYMDGYNLSQILYQLFILNLFKYKILFKGFE